MSEPEPVFSEPESIKARVAVLMGSDSDWPVMKQATSILRDSGVPFDVEVLSAHRTPERVREYVRSANGQGVQVFVVGAGGAAHLAGVVAAHTTLPVVAVPLDATSLSGLDALLACVQMPSGIPVATMAINGAQNAALMAVAILALADPGLHAWLEAYRRELAAKTILKSALLKKRTLESDS